MVSFLVMVGAMRILAKMGRRSSSTARRMTRFLVGRRAAMFLGNKEGGKILGVEEQQAPW